VAEDADEIQGDEEGDNGECTGKVSFVIGAGRGARKSLPRHAGDEKDGYEYLRGGIVVIEDCAPRPVGDALVLAVAEDSDKGVERDDGEVHNRGEKEVAHAGSRGADTVTASYMVDVVDDMEDSCRRLQTLSVFSSSGMPWTEWGSYRDTANPPRDIIQLPHKHHAQQQPHRTQQLHNPQRYGQHSNPQQRPSRDCRCVCTLCSRDLGVRALVEVDIGGHWLGLRDHGRLGLLREALGVEAIQILHAVEGRIVVWEEGTRGGVHSVGHRDVPAWLAGLVLCFFLFVGLFGGGGGGG
jgi:hypothetical protein